MSDLLAWVSSVTASQVLAVWAVVVPLIVAGFGAWWTEHVRAQDREHQRIADSERDARMAELERVRLDREDERLATAHRLEKSEKRIAALKEACRRIAKLGDSELSNANKGAPVGDVGASSEVISDFFMIAPEPLARAATQWLDGILVLGALRGTPEYKPAVDRSFAAQAVFMKEVRAALSDAES